MHLLPGLALFAHRYHTPTGLRGLRNLAATTQQLLMLHNDGHAAAADLLGVVPAAEQPTPLWLWLVAAPLAFYIAWQLLYFLVVQVGRRLCVGQILTTCPLVCMRCWGTALQVFQILYDRTQDTVDQHVQPPPLN